MKKTLIVIGALLGVVLILGFFFRAQLGFWVAMQYITPDVTFAEAPHPSPPDYGSAAHWAALPDRDDGADATPQSDDTLDNQADAAVDVFFIHPTTFFSSAHWNQPLDDEDANSFVDELVLPNQAAVFNSCCRVYVPRYRQATLYSFFSLEGDGKRALEFAYADVRRAFDHFLTHYNRGRPFIIAGHSQGAYHSDTLLRDIQDEPAFERMVAAYPIGYYIDANNGVPICAHANDTRCQVGWNAVPPGGDRFAQVGQDLCVNPITWQIDGTHADFADNLGAVSMSAGGQIEAGATDAQCVDGQLVVTEVRSDNFVSGVSGNNYHLYDYSFFHMNIRANAVARVAAYLAAAPGGAD